MINIIDSTNNNTRDTLFENLIPHGSIEIINDSNFTDYGFSGSGTAENPYIISGFNITILAPGKGISVKDTTKHFIIENCYIDTFDDCIFLHNVSSETAIIKSNQLMDSNRFGIRIVDSSNILIVNNTVDNHYQSGISLNVCPYSFIENNTITGTGIGSGGSCIAIESSAFTSLVNNTCRIAASDGIYLTNSPNSLIKNNYCIDNRDNGIWTYDYCSDSLVFNNTIIGCTKGINIWEAYRTKVYNNTCEENEFGLNIYKSSSINVKHNVLNGNSKNGIVLGVSSMNCEIIFNNITENSLYGTTVTESAEFNVFHHNNFIDNNKYGSCQASDDGKKTTWYDEDSKEGNYWSDREKRGPYKIDGTANSEDPYPLKEPVNNFTTIKKTDSLQLWIVITFIIIVTNVWRKRRLIFRKESP